MAIEFTCSSCQSRHACADHMVGREFRCGGCGKMLTVPTPGEEGITTRPRPARVAPDDDGYVEPESRGEMGVGTQTTLLVIGGIVLVAVLLVVCSGGGMLWWWGAPHVDGEQGPIMDMAPLPHEGEVVAPMPGPPPEAGGPAPAEMQGTRKNGEPKPAAKD